MKRLLSTLFLCLFAQAVALFAEQRYTLTLKSSPQGLCTFYIFGRYSTGTYANGSVHQVIAGERIQLYANNLATGWKPVGWRVTEGNGEADYAEGSTSGGMTMPENDVTVTLFLEYDPDTPDNPMPNAWYPDEGTLVIDYFAKGSFYTLANQLVPDAEDKAMVTTVIMCGYLSYGSGNPLDYLTANSYPNLHRVDISRLESASSLDFSNLRNRPWQQLLLPACVKSFGENILENTNLEEMWLYATTPPKLSFKQEKDETGNYVKMQKSLPPDLKIYVPQEAMPLYLAAEGWRDMDLSPIIKDAASLSVSVEAPGSDLSPYYGMTLELLNIQSLYKRVMLIGSRKDYTFSTLPKQTSYDLRLLSRTGAVVAQAKNVRIDNDDVNVKLSNLRRTCSLQLAVSDGTATIDAQRYSCLWTGSDGHILSRGNSIEGILDDEALKAVIMLNDADLRKVYRERDTITVVANAQSPILNYQLKPIPAFRLTTLVKRADGQFFNNETARMNIHHAGGGQLVRQLQFSKLTPDGWLSSGEQEPLTEGEYDITVSVDGTSLNIAKQHLSLHGDQTLTFSLEEPKGSTVNIKWKHYGVAAEGEVIGDSNGSEMGITDAAITLYDVTNGRNLKDFTITPEGKLRLKELLEPDTEVRLTLGNVANTQFAPVVLLARADTVGNLSYNVVTRDYGTLNVGFSATECSRVSIRIYDGKGLLVTAGNAVSVSSAFTLLKDGQYTVLLMEGGTMAEAMNTMTDVEKFLRRGIDYVSQEVTVSSGQTSAVSFATVPSLGSDVHLYTDDTKTRITPRRAQLSVGVTQTISAVVAFRPEYKGRVSNLQVVFDFPDDEAVRFLKGSVIIDNSTATYTVNRTQLTIPILEGDITRFCVVPHKGGSMSLSAKATFLLDGVKCEQPLPVTSFTVKEADIEVVEQSAEANVAVSGSAIASTAVTVFVNNQETATTTSNIYGAWKLMVPLAADYNGGVNTIYAQYTGIDGFKVKTPEKTVVFNRANIYPVSVRMSHYNKYTNSQQIVDFDLVNNTCTPGSYKFFQPAEFTFDVRLNTTDSAYIDRVLLYVYMSGDQRRLLFPKYNTKTGTWVATDMFDASTLPAQVRVYVEDHMPDIISERLFSDRIHVLDNLYKDYVAPDTLMQRLTATLENSTPGSEEHTEAIRQVMTLSGINPDEVIDNAVELPDTPEALSQWKQEMNEALAKIDEAFDRYDKMKAEGYLDANVTPFNQLGTVLGGYTFSTIPEATRQYYEARARGLNPAPPTATDPNEYEYEIEMENGSHAYYRISDNGYTLIIPSEDLQVTLNYAALDTEIASAVRELQTGLSRLAEMKQQIPFRGKSDEIIAKLEEVMDIIGHAMSKVASELAVVKDYIYGVRDGFQMMYDDHIDELYKTTQDGWNKFWSSNKKWVNNDEFIKMRAKGAVAAMKMRDLRKGQKFLQDAAKWLGNIGKIVNIIALISDGSDLIDVCSKLLELSLIIPDPCKDDQAAADQIFFEFNTWGLARVIQKAYAFATDATSVAATLAGVASGAGTLGVGTAIGLAVSLALSVTNYAANKISDNYWNSWVKEWEQRIDDLQCDNTVCKAKNLRFDNGKTVTDASGGKCGDKCQRTRNAKKGEAPGGCPGPSAPGGGAVGILDPSGYVYEAVGSNRVAEALASVYYKETYEDMYGDVHERTVLWDATQFDQVNPMYTDKNGEYGWDVPTGMWQVRVVKDGFLDTYSEWLPVPPPQLDVNLAMQQPSAPVVERVVATEQGVELTFDKYMKPAHLTTDNIFLTRGTEKLEGTVSLLDAETTPDSLHTYARRVLFQPHQPLKLDEKVRLTVKAGVESYADVALVNDFTQEFDVELRVNKLVADSIVGILYGEQNILTVSAQPAAAAAGKKVVVSSLNPDIASIADNASENLELTLNEDGKATVTVKGKSFGTTALHPDR